MYSLRRQRGFWGAVIGAGASLLGGMMAREGQEELNEDNIDFMEAKNAQSIAMAREQMAFQERMRGSRHQAEVRDLELAGLNPMLSLQHGGAASPGGAGAEFGVPSLGNAPAIGVHTAQAAAKVGAEIDLLEAQAEKAKTEAQVNLVQVPKIAQDQLTSMFSAGHLEAQTKEVMERVGQIIPAQRYELMQRGDELGASRMLKIEQALHEYERRSLTREDLKLRVEEILHEKERAGLTRAERRHSELDLPRAANIERQQSSWWMRNVSPYLPDFLRGSASGRALRGTFR